MSFHFNWSRLDETAAEAIRLLINKKLRDMLDDKLGGDGACSNGDSSPATAPAASSSVFTGAHSTSPFVSLCTGGGSGPNSCLSTTGGAGGMGGNPNGLSPAFGSTGALPAGAGGGATCDGSGSVSAAAAGQGLSASGDKGARGRSGGDVVGLTGAAPTSTSAAATTTTATATKTATTTTTTTTTTAAHAGAAQGPLGSAGSGTAATAKKPLLEHLTVTSLEWGTAPPFVELVNFSDALRFTADQPPPESPLNSTSYQDSPFLSSAGSLAHPSFQDQKTPGSVRGGGLASAVGGGDGHAYGRHSPQLFTPTAAPVSAAAATAGPNPTAAGHSVAASSGAVCGSANGVDAMNESGTSKLGSGHNASINNSRLQQQRGLSGNACGQGESLETSAAALGDTLAPFLGPGGLFVRLHVTYGGSLRFSLSSAIQYDLTVLSSSITLPLRMPLALYVSDIDLDCYVCCNLHKNRCQLWLEPGKLSASPINRIGITGVFGEKRGGGFHGNTTEGSGASGVGFAAFNGNGNLPITSNGGNHNNNVSSTTAAAAAADGGDYDGDSSLDYFSRYESSFSEDGNDNDTVFLDERQVEQFLLRELKALLKDRIIAPHYVSLPVIIG